MEESAKKCLNFSRSGADIGGRAAGPSQPLTDLGGRVVKGAPKKIPDVRQIFYEA